MTTATKSAPRPPIVHPNSIRADFDQCDWWTVGEAAKYAGKGCPAIRKWIREKRFTARSNFTPYRVYAPDFKHFIDTGESKVTPLTMHSTA